GLPALAVQEGLAEVALRVGARPRPVDVPPREEERLAQAVDEAALLAPEPAYPMGAQPEPAHHAVDPLGGHPPPVAPVLLLDVKGILQLDVSPLQEPDVEIHVVLDRPEAVIAEAPQRRIRGSPRLDRADPPVERLPEADQPGSQRGQLALATAGRAVGQVPDMPQLVLYAVDGHQVKEEEVPITPLHQE